MYPGVRDNRIYFRYLIRNSALSYRFKTFIFTAVFIKIWETNENHSGMKFRTILRTRFRSRYKTCIDNRQKTLR